MNTENQTNNETKTEEVTLPEVERVNDEALANMYRLMQVVNEAEHEMRKVPIVNFMNKAQKAEVLMSATRDLMSAQCSLIHNLKAEITRLRKYGFGAE